MLKVFKGISTDLKNDARLGLDHLRAYASFDWETYWAAVGSSSVPVANRTVLLEILPVYLQIWSVAAAVQDPLLEVALAADTISCPISRDDATVCSEVTN